MGFLSLAPLASRDLGYSTWLEIESFARTPHVTPNEDSSTGRTPSRDGDAGHESFDEDLGDEVSGVGR